MTLIQLPVSEAWVFRSAETIIRVAGHYTHQTRQEAVSRAEEAGLVVSADGTVTPRQTTAERL